MKYISGILTASLACAPLSTSGFVVRPALHSTLPAARPLMSKVEPMDHLTELSEVDEFCVENVAEVCQKIPPLGTRGEGKSVEKLRVG
mmetsp:Transcript_44254/g.134763  ORF Transcript_44254/g.134763 Transcript_44254/m.134763 type:complete len:88 (-) Transcript_44254:685-948(-)